MKWLARKQLSMYQLTSAEKVNVLSLVCLDPISFSVLDGHLHTGSFKFVEAKKACEDGGMTLPKKPFRFLNWESINFGSFSGDRAFARKAFWVDDDNSKYEEYEEARKIDYLVTLMKINQNDTHPLCAFLSE